MSISALVVADEDGLAAAAACLRAGGLVAFPTETVYGLGALATDSAAVARIYAAKGRPPNHPLIVHLAGADELPRWTADVPETAVRLAAALWPGPLTIVLRRSPRLPPAAAGGRDTVGLRVPDHPAALRLLELVRGPIAAPSANRFGRVSPTMAGDVCADLGTDVDLVVDGGPCRVGVESTIVELVGGPPTLLRPGGVPTELIEAVLGAQLRTADVGPARASGMLPSHYAPGCRVELVSAGQVAARARVLLAGGARVAVLAAGATPGLESAPGLLVLPSAPSVEEAARTLYRRLREADEAGTDVLLAVPPSPEGLGLAVVDRLHRAAAPRG